ncbi:uncharacterized protein LOC141856146 [Brevipalpus obovatus]|uniref:uncharacterized protein LOC141856146 n=1 Tax=Brevipalpus obovatus TaxID=246614 RepID=UPI003D9E09FA
MSGLSTSPHILSSAINAFITGTPSKPEGNPFPGNSSLNQTHHKNLQGQHPATIIIPASPATTAQVRNTHTVQYKSVTWTCPQCQIPFKTASELQGHLSAHTKQEKSVPCQQCGKLFASAERVRIHIRAAHGEKSCACEICGSGFSYRCKLLDHMRTHTGDKPFTCESCGRSFSQKNHLRRHSMIHTGERPFPCDICGRGFYRKDKLSRHRRIHLNPNPGQRKLTSCNSTTLTNSVTAVSAVTGQQHIVTSLASSPTTIQLIPVSLNTLDGQSLAHSSWIATPTSNLNNNPASQQQQQQQQQSSPIKPNIHNTSTSLSSTPTTSSS